ncbi:MAG: FadR/GntR family transcriptional regulator [Sedimentibacter saalensis]|uniref:FadR/GntR family transcriptional regulator n=1 Tax=Sedimentibacter saalensis TaxID=130788 RepID=UPI0031596CC9
MFETIENKKISQMVIEQIQGMIMRGELKNGDKLPPERELTQTLNIGRPALREALKALEVIGVIESRHGQGNFVVNNTENSVFKPLSLSFKLSNGNIEEILELRRLIEDYTVKQAASLSNEKEAMRLREIHNAMINAETTEQKSQYDKQFHYEIAKISKNILINSLFESTSYLFDSFINKTVRMSFFGEDSIDKIYDEHLRIIEAIEKHDAKEAAKRMQIHMNNIDVYLLNEQ